MRACHNPESATLLDHASANGIGEEARAARDYLGALSPELEWGRVVDTSPAWHLQVVALPGQAYRTQTSSDLSQWVTIDTRTTSTNRYEVVDPEASSPGPRFYRVVW